MMGLLAIFSWYSQWIFPHFFYITMTESTMFPCKSTMFPILKSRVYPRNFSNFFHGKNHGNNTARSQRTSPGALQGSARNSPVSRPCWRQQTIPWLEILYYWSEIIVEYIRIYTYIYVYIYTYNIIQYYNSTLLSVYIFHIIPWYIPLRYWESTGFSGGNGRQIVYWASRPGLG